MANADPAQPQQQVRGANVPPIERAAIEFGTKKRFDLDGYVFTVVDDGPMRVVLLQDRRREDAIGPWISYEAGFDRETLEKLKSYYFPLSLRRHRPLLVSVPPAPSAGKNVCNRTKVTLG
jgi:hypothetical protein